MTDHLGSLCSLEYFLKEVILRCVFQTVIKLVNKNVQKLSSILLYAFLNGRDKSFEQFLWNVVLSL